jgi:hypothetical protein
MRHLIALSILVAAPAAAQQAGGQHAGHQGAQHGAHHAAPAEPHFLQEHFAGITLSAELKRRLIALHDEHHAKMKAVKDAAKAAGKTDDDAATKAAVAKLMEQEHAAFRAALPTDADRVKFDALQKRGGGEAKPRG